MPEFYSKPYRLMKSNILKEKAFVFALDVIHLYKNVCDSKKEFVLSKQFLRSGTSIGANISEAEYAESKLDFIHKLAIALKEANETKYWLELLYLSGYIDQMSFDTIQPRVIEQIKLLTSIINTSKKQ